jgi:hypothetical protein
MQLPIGAIMNTNITLDESHFKAVFDKARASGKTPEQYVQDLIDADNGTFDEILSPVRRGFDSMTDDELEDLLNRAQNAARQSK